MDLSNPEALRGLLRSVFGFAGFRANQEEVCRAAIAGRDLLLVMPTGAGKSLCYQLPAIARGGTALVISPLISLMEDQAAKLAAAWPARGAHSLRPGAQRGPSGVRRVSARRSAIPVHRAGAFARSRISRDAGQAKARVGRHRRSALHLAMGPRLPARLSDAGPVSACAARLGKSPRRSSRSPRPLRRACKPTSSRNWA